MQPAEVRSLNTFLYASFVAFALITIIKTNLPSLVIDTGWEAHNNNFTTLRTTSENSMIHFAAAAVLASTLVLYAAVFVDYERLTIPTYHQHIKSIRRRARKNAILYSHTFCGLVEILRWHIRNLWDPTPTADALDMLLCLVQSGTNLALVKNLVRGTPAMTRPSYQAGAIFRPILTFFAWQTANPALHKSSVKALNAFIYCRMLIFFMNTFITQDAMSRATMYK